MARVRPNALSRSNSANGEVPNSSMASKKSKGPAVDIATENSSMANTRLRPTLSRTTSKSKPNQQRRFRGWCITDNNYREEEIDRYRDINGCTYGILGREIAPVTKTPHLQGYLYFKTNITRGAAVKRINTATGRKPFIRGADGSAAQNRVYCSKSNKFVEWGAIPAQGTRSDLLNLKDALNDLQKSNFQVWKENFPAMLKYFKGAAKYKQLQAAEKAGAWRKIHVTLIMGPTGIGKTRQALWQGDELIPDTYLIHGGDMNWWDGYEGQNRLVIDEYANQIKITDLLSLLDGNKKRLNIKHAFGYANWKKVIITTNLFELHEKAKPAHKDALQRRITTTIDL